VLELEPWRAFDFYKSFLAWYCSWYEPRYLEIGCASGELCMSLNTKSSMGVDVLEHPDWDTYIKRGEGRVDYFIGPSDKFFASIDDRDQYDLIFIDGDHSYDQVTKDVVNSLVHLAKDGLIVMHDTLPPTRDHTHELWSGTAYRAAIALRRSEDLEVYTFPVTFGLTLVGRVGKEFPWVP
jgi:hypothetical protein